MLLKEGVKIIHKTAEISKNAVIGRNTRIWHLCQIREGVKIGDNCIIGKNSYIDSGVKIGNKVKIQNNSSVYRGSEIKEGVFIGPNCVLANDNIPRAINPDKTQKKNNDWECGKITINEGASLGAGTIILPNITIGKYAMIGAGSVVTKDIPDFALAYGNPAKIKGYVCKCGNKLVKHEEILLKISSVLKIPRGILKKCKKCNTVIK